MEMGVAFVVEQFNEGLKAEYKNVKLLEKDFRPNSK
jgi:hypothetical protein